MRAEAVLLLSLLALAACEQREPVLEALKPLPGGAAGTASPRVNGAVGTTDLPPSPELSYGQPQPLTAPAPGALPKGGAVSLDFADTDIREVVAQILGNILHVTYTIDPAIHGTATLHTSAPLSNAQLIPALQALLGQNNAALVQSGGIYRVVPASSAAVAAATTPGAPPGAPGAAAGAPGINAPGGSAVVALRYAGAEELAKVLQPFAGNAVHIVPDPARNALILSGDPEARATITNLVRAFDIDLLAGQSYALLPAGSGDAKDFASALQDAFRAQKGSPLADLVRVVPMARVNSVLVVASQPRYIDDARRVYALVERTRRATVRTWHVYYLQNSHANDAAYVLQRAFTPNDVTAQPTETTQGAQAGMGAGIGQQAGYGGGGYGAGGGRFGGSSVLGSGGGIGSGSISGPTLGGAGMGGGTFGGGGIGGGIGGGGAGVATGGLSQSQPAANTSANPLLGGLEPGGNGAQQQPNAMRIIPNPQNNAILVYATQQEEDTVEAMLRKLDILPLQVRIDAVIAEVTLNNALQYGTQFFFKSGGINGVLSTASQSFTAANLASATFGTTLPGFIIGGKGLGGAPLAISALQSVTTVHVLSSPELLVLDNQPARLQVGNLVPYLTSSSQSQIVSGAPVVNSVNYQPTGVIMQVTPRVNSGGLVTLDVSQEVSDVDNSSPKASGIDSPTFLERNVTSRIVVQDGQTVGLAGLIRDSATRGNAGIPWLKDVPVLGFLAGSQNNNRTRTELLVLITPHVLHDQRDARALTEDLRDQLINAAVIPQEMQSTRPFGSPDPNERVRKSVLGR